MTRYLTCVFWLTCALLGQSPRLTNVRGELQGRVSSETQVEVTRCSGPATDTVTAHVDPAGGFEFRNLESGCYQVSVVQAMTGRKLYQGVHDVGRHGDALLLRIEQPKQDRPVTGGVSLSALRPKPPKKAMRLFDQAAELSQRGGHAEAAEKLREVLRLHPAFAEAHINLGAQYSRMRQPAAALEEFEKARLLGIHTAPLWTNIATAHVEMQNLPAAQVALREALREDAEFPQAHFIAGQMSLRAGRVEDAAVHLKRAVALPAARIVLAQILTRTGRAGEAATELRAYLASGHAPYRAVAEKWLRQLAQ